MRIEDMMTQDELYQLKLLTSLYYCCRKYTVTRKEEYGVGYLKG